MGITFVHEVAEPHDEVGPPLGDVAGGRRRSRSRSAGTTPAAIRNSVVDESIGAVRPVGEVNPPTANEKVPGSVVGDDDVEV